MSSTAATPSPKTAVKIVFGCMTFGAPGAEQSRVHDLDDCRSILDIFASHGHTELDTARMYGLGTSEEYLSKLGYTTPSDSHHFQIATKSFPSARKPDFPAKSRYTFEPADIARAIEDSLKALGTDSFDLFYLHSPDREVELERTLRAVNEAYEQGKFKRFGVSNYRADEVQTIVDITTKNNWVKPSVYQGLYNSITRSAESELFPVLRKNNIAYYAYNPLGGGLFTGQLAKDTTPESGSRFDPERAQGKMYRARYWNDHYFQALDKLKPAADKHGLTLAEVALRWMMHHSQLKKQHGDAVIIGASSKNHIEGNLRDFEKGELPEDVVKAVDEAWEIVKPNAPAYHH
ncbi:NADP-dependent oxidoreductase domain protein [Kalmanozyma brasiliensis GHG001]|uniref:NADP-dependent oxidoreductase domain-containing protein n=1 Tax=Kalmanozyma brasiliensis (strain GHG001) TaxID=1365824 RepID=V5EU65_KALBG|nr:NADP-dependent oxidoreductase domain protein [Kalmanozyma brasiliensis GHG001]EST06653.1 NADP-dependent oxidoreductase domain protein [Kalmanozyma brasiliensis GHG001]